MGTSTNADGTAAIGASPENSRIFSALGSPIVGNSRSTLLLALRLFSAEPFPALRLASSIRFCRVAARSPSKSFLTLRARSFSRSAQTAGMITLGRINRSEERRVGKECRSRGAPDQQKKKHDKPCYV